MEKSREKPVVADNEQVQLQAVPRRALPAMKPVAKREVGHSHETIHERLVAHYQYKSESAPKSPIQAGLGMEIAKNMDDHGVKKGRPLHERFAGMLG